MASFTAPSGKVYQWDKPQPPTQADIDAIVAFDAANAEARSPKNYKGPETYDYSPDAMVAGFTPKQERENIGAFVKVAAPMAAIPATAGMAIPAAIGTLAAVGAASEMAGSAIAGQPQSLGRTVSSAILSGAPGVKAAAAPIFSWNFLANAAKGGAAMGGTATAANYADRAIEKGTLMPFDSYRDAFKESVVPMILGAGTAGLAGKVQNRGQMKMEMEASKKALSELGIKNPLLGDLLPKQYGQLQESVAAHYPDLANKIAQSRAPMVKEFYSMIGDLPMNETIAARLQPVIGKMDEAEALHKAAYDRLMKAQAVAEKAKQDVSLSVEQRSKLMADATAEQMAAISDQAAAAMKAQVAADAIGTQTGRAEALKGSIGNLFKARSRAADDMMAATGIDPKAQIFSQDRIMQAARNALGDRADTVAGRAILLSIEKAKGAGVEQGMAVGMKEAGLKPDELRQLTNPGGELSLTELRQLRDKMSDSFAGKVDTNGMNSAEQLASSVYASIGNAAKADIARVYGKESLQNYDQFLKFWRTTSQLRDSSFGRMLLRGEISDESVKSMAQKLATGQVDEVQNFTRFIDTIKSQNKEAADMAMATMGSAVRNSFLEQAASGGQVDYRKLSGLLQAAASKKGLPFPVETFGFGDAKTIAGWNRALQEFKPSELTLEAVESVMQSPQVQDMLRAGGKDIAPRLRTILATKAFNKRVIEAEAMKAAGLTTKSKQAYQDAVELAKKAEMDADTATKAVCAASDDPLLSVFRGKSGYVFTNEAAKDFGPGTISHLVSGMRRDEGAAMMKGLREKMPDVAEMVERRLLAGEMAKMISAEGDLPGQLYRLNPYKVRAYFNPPEHARLDSDVSKMMAVLGPERMSRFKKFSDALSQIDDRTRAGAIAAGIRHPVDETAATAGAVATGSLARGYFTGKLLDSLRAQFNRKRFNIASAMLMDDKFANAVADAGGDVTEAIASLPAQKAYLLINDKAFAEELGK
jgi:hypothetical protein